MTETGRGEQERRLDDDLLALLDDGLGEAGVLLVAGDGLEPLGDLAGPRPRREVVQGRRPALGLRDDGARHAHHVAVLEVEGVGEQPGQVVAGPHLGQPADGEDVHGRPTAGRGKNRADPVAPAAVTGSARDGSRRRTEA